MFAVGKSGAVDIIGERKGFRRGIIAVKKRMEAVLNRRLPRSSAGMLNAMILGGRSEAPKYINTALQRTGTVHILAVSGLHVGIVAFIVLAGLKLLAMPYRWRYATAMIILLGYCFLTGARIPIVRATIMAEVLLAGVLLFRSYDPLSALSLAACLILIVCPQQLFDVGFQLSFISVFFDNGFLQGFRSDLARVEGGGGCAAIFNRVFFSVLDGVDRHSRGCRLLFSFGDSGGNHCQYDNCSVAVFNRGQWVYIADQCRVGPVC
jgi:ComEC/Rec2-related protein